VTDYDRIGGAEGLIAIFEDFVPMVFEDFIIGFMFVGRDRRRVLSKEVELAASHLGGPRNYTGRPLDQVHKPLPINRGHFRRRMALLRKVLASHRVDDDIVERWVGHNEALLDQIMAGDIDCVD
jgi:hemoglobin